MVFFFHLLLRALCFRSHDFFHAVKFGFEVRNFKFYNFAFLIGFLEIFVVLCESELVLYSLSEATSSVLFKAEYRESYLLFGNKF